jgi:hypothetical protein
MKSFKDLTESKNTHMTHIEDKVIYGGVKGTREAILALRELRDMLAGKGTSGLSTKWDGAPAIFCGQDPADGKFFVAKKGIFNKNPKVYKTNADVEADTSGDLADKLKDALKYLPELVSKELSKETSYSVRVMYLLRLSMDRSTLLSIQTQSSMQYRSISQKKYVTQKSV